MSINPRMQLPLYHAAVGSDTGLTRFPPVNPLAGTNVTDPGLNVVRVGSGRVGSEVNYARLG